jgi:GntR family transcriptional regulator/MocR family aminotransferase
MALAISIEPASPIAIHRQIYEAWQRGILSGRFASGDRVPSTRELAVTLAVSRSTVTQAYEQLISEGYLQAARGSGTFVCRELPDRSLLRTQAAVRLTPHRSLPPPLSRYGSGLLEDYSDEPRRPGFVCFSQWGPDLVQFPWMLWRRILSRHLRHVRRDIFDYARQVQGYEPLRREIAGYVSRSRAVNCTPSQVIVVNGSQQGLDLCARLLFERGDKVALENPGYPGAIHTFSAYGASLQPVAVDQDGLVCADLGRGARLVYVTPSHQYPTGVAMSLNRRLELLAWARRQTAVIIEDDYDSEYRYSGSPLPALQGLAQEVPVIYCGTFSKVMFPGLRIGYLIVPENLVTAFTRAKRLADNYTPILEQIALRDFIADGHLARHVRRMRRLYGSRREALLEALNRHFGDCATLQGDAAGMHAFVRIEDKALRERAERNKVQLRSAQACFMEGGDAHHYLFGFSSLTERAIRDGIRRIAAAPTARGQPPPSRPRGAPP